MNHIYKLKFDKRRNEIVVVSEITTGPGKVHTSRGTKKNVVSMVNNLARSVLSVLILAGLGSPALAAGLPVGGQVVAGSASIQKPTENQMNIHQNSAHAVLNWNSFDIGQGHTVQFYQPDSSAVALNRVVGGNESHIMGNLNANGRVFLVNPNGVLFGKGASVNTAGLVATTRDIKNEDFMNGKYVFSGQKGQGEVVNQGNLTTTKGGFIVLAGDRVRNSGTIRTPEGRAVLAAAEKVTLQLDNAGLTSVAVNGSVVNALVENSGLVSASDGQVLLTARGKNMLMNTVLNNSGVVEAQGLSVKDGNIVLDGGDSGVVQHSGTLMADNNRGRGGKVVVEGQHILLDEHSRITATGRQGGGEVYVGGGWQGKDTGIRHAQKVVMLKGANIDVSATEKGNGGTAVLWSDEYTRFHGNIQAKGGQTSGNGGQVETSSHNNLQAFGQVDASAATGRGGEWLLDPADITIVDNGTNTNVTNSTTNSTSVFTPDANATTGQVGVTNINNLLNNGTSVNITTSNSAAGNGSITVNAAINKTNGTDATLTLFADGNITVNKNITSSNGALNVNLFGANSRDGAVNISRSNITTNNGNLTIS
ncbi:filamentous hemagglutinin N-terminal domain-containing protein, partial [Cronobacter sakazakii]|nr:filamentous hemagglutinin N-terminal domain-containing protein [Cronobacter sakazakii]